LSGVAERTIWVRDKEVKQAIRAAFVMEQTLGHVTHGKNMSQVLAGQSAVAPTWLPIAFDMQPVERLVPLWRSNWSLRASSRARMALEGALRRQPHDVIFFHTQVVSLFSTGLMKRLPSIISLDATPANMDSVGEFYGHRAAGDGLLDRQKYALNRRAMHAADALVAWSEWARRSLIDDYGAESDRIRVIAPGAAPAYFEIGHRRHASGDAAMDVAAPRSARDDNLIRLLFVGGDFRRKGGHLLLEALRGPLSERCELHIVTRERVAPQPNVHVHHGLGPNSPELLRLFAESDVFVLPSLGECLAVVLMEATAAGLPVITTRVGALAEAVRPGESGLLVPTGDPGALREALVALVDDSSIRRRMGRAGLALADAKFDAARNNQAILDLLVEVACVRDNERRAA
jgi:glycosyltransferase involved in cell wall biosynthesis